MLWIAHDVNELLKMLAKVSPPEQLHIACEAGPTGYGLQRALQAKGYECDVIAPAQMPRRPGIRVKTDGQDCVQLAECSRAGQLRKAWVPDVEDEAIRDLARGRVDAVNSRSPGWPRPAWASSIKSGEISNDQLGEDSSWR